MPDNFSPGSPLERMADAAQAGDPGKMQTEAPAVKEKLTELAEAIDLDDAAKALEAAKDLGIPIVDAIAEVLPYVNATKAGIKVVNGIAGIVAAVALREDETLTVAPIRLASGEWLHAVIKLSASIEKENKGWEIGDNFERITDLVIKVEALNGTVMEFLSLTAEITGIGVGQDTIDVALKVDSAQTASDGTGPDTPVATTKFVDGPGFKAQQISSFVRNGATKLTVTKGDPAEIQYGINGANVAIVLEVSGHAIVQGQTVPLNKLTVLDIGLSI